MCWKYTEKLPALRGKVAERKLRKADGRWLWSGSYEPFFARKDKN